MFSTVDLNYEIILQDVTDQLLIRSFAFDKYWRRNESTMRQYISYS
jgi:hypothetical protein